MSSAITPTLSAELNEVRMSYPQWAQTKFVHLRGLVFDVARADPRIGEVHEALRWNEPACLTQKTKVWHYPSGRMVIALTRYNWRVF
jgi:hypothetical protein